MSENERHSAALNYLLFHPDKLGIADLLRWSATEINVYRPGTTELETQIDLLYRTESGIYVAEYKGGKTGNSRKAHRQLDKAAEFIKREFGSPPTRIYVKGESFHYETWR